MEILGIPEVMCSLKCLPSFDECSYTHTCMRTHTQNHYTFLLITSTLLKRSVSENPCLYFFRVLLLYQEIFLPGEMTLF